VLSEYVIGPERALVASPAFLSDVEVAALPCAGVTAWHALFVRAPLEPDDRVLIQGTGGVALFALQFANAAGVLVECVTCRFQKAHESAKSARMPKRSCKSLANISAVAFKEAGCIEFFLRGDGPIPNTSRHIGTHPNLDERIGDLSHIDKGELIACGCPTVGMCAKMGRLPGLMLNRARSLQ
jgi:hypothetical protein